MPEKHNFFVNKTVFIKVFLIKRSKKTVFMSIIWHLIIWWKVEFDLKCQTSSRFRPFLIKYNFFDHNHVRIRTVATNPIKSGDNFGSKKSIKKRFEYDLKQILAGGQLDCISLLCWWDRESAHRHRLSSRCHP